MFSNSLPATIVTIVYFYLKESRNYSLIFIIGEMNLIFLPSFLGWLIFGKD